MLFLSHISLFDFAGVAEIPGLERFNINAPTRLDSDEVPLPGTVAPVLPLSPQKELAQAYLLPLPGLDPNFVHHKSGLGSAPGSSRRPESRNTTNSASTPGALARRANRANPDAVSQSLDSAGGGALFQGPHPRGDAPRAHAQTPMAAAFPASGMYAPDEDDDDVFPAPPGGLNPLDDGSSARPVSRSVLLKSGIEVTPYHTEVVTEIYKHPLLIALLTSVKKARPQQKKNPVLENLTRPTLSTGSKSRDEYDDFVNTGLAQMSIYGQRPDVPRFDRLVVKIFDVIGHHEYLITAQITEYIKFRGELETKYEGQIASFFVPEDRDWWKDNIRHLVRVQLKRNGLLHMTISKQAIEDLVVAAMRKAAEETPSMKFGRRSTRLPTRRSMLGSRGSILRTSSNSQKSDRSSPPSVTSGSPKSRYNTVSNDSDRAVVVASALEDDYDDYDFEP
jgi:hypothetical protein